MAKIAKQLTELIGHTPLLELTNYEKALGLEAKIIAKLEYFNPLGSVKDRVAAAMIEQGIKDGKINQDTIIIEPTSGNTGIGLAFVAASKGLHLILIMPDTMSVERRKIVTALGAEIKLTPGREGMKGAIDEAQRLKEHYGNAFIPQQFENQANPDIHRATTAQEIWEDTDGKVDIFVSSVGTGGTCTGTGLGLRDHNPDVRIVAVEPKSSPVSKEYLQYLYSDEAQQLIGESGYRPTNQDILNRFSDKFDLNIRLWSIEDYGGWNEAYKTYFDDGAMFDEIYGN